MADVFDGISGFGPGHQDRAPQKTRMGAPPNQEIHTTTEMLRVMIPKAVRARRDVQNALKALNTKVKEREQDLRRQIMALQGEIAMLHSDAQTKRTLLQEEEAVLAQEEEALKFALKFLRSKPNQPQ